MIFINNFIICSSTGNGNTELNSFDEALLNSGVANYNLVKVSSILPADMSLRKEISLKEGEVLFTAYASKTTKRKGELISSAVAVGIPNDPASIGVIMEYSGVCTKDEALQMVENMVRDAMNTRNKTIKKVLSTSVENKCESECFVTTFAAIAMW